MTNGEAVSLKKQTLDLLETSVVGEALRKSSRRTRARTGRLGLALVSINDGCSESQRQSETVSADAQGRGSDKKTSEGAGARGGWLRTRRRVG